MDLKETLGDWYNPLSLIVDTKDFLNMPGTLGNFIPAKDKVFKAFQLTQLKDVRVVILGQNPYPNPNHATGLAFGVPSDCIDLPPTLTNIMREVEQDIYLGAPYFAFDHTLESWARQGVLLLNTALTTPARESVNWHKTAWEPFTKQVFRAIEQKHTGVVFILWGNDAKAYKKYINSDQYILESAHPSPLSAYKGFFNSKPFSKTNVILKSINNIEINW